MSWRGAAVVLVLAGVSAACYESAFPLDPEPRVDVGLLSDGALCARRPAGVVMAGRRPGRYATRRNHYV